MEVKPAVTYAAMSQRRSPASTRVTWIGREGHTAPSGVHYEACVGDSYYVDVLNMEQTHVESGSIRKVRREKPGAWRYFKRGGSWGLYPKEVSVELERIFLSLGNRRPSWDSKGTAEESKVSPLCDSLSISPTERVSGAPLSPCDLNGMTIANLVDMEGCLPNNSFTSDVCAAAVDMLFSTAEEGDPSQTRLAAKLLCALISRHGFHCGVHHARRAGLVVGSMHLLQAVLHSSPQMFLVGEDLFDKKYPKLRIQDFGRKNCIRCLLARGMNLGKNDRPPHSKLLRKLEADAEPQWVERCLDAMMRQCPQLPESVSERVCELLGFEEGDE